MNTTYQASSLDMLRSDSRILTVLGPADFGSLERVRERVLAVASTGPSARVGLRATHSSTAWSYEPERVLEHITEGPPIGADQLAKELAEFAHSVSVDIPIRIRLVGEYLLLDINHGLGDALLPIDLLAYLGNADPHAPLPAWTDTTVEGRPLRKALFRWVSRNPGKVVDILYGRVRPAKAAAFPPPEPRSTETTPWTPSAAVAVAATPPGTTDAIRQWRKENLPGITVSAILCSAIATAFERNGIDLARSTALLFDCRRYLPPSSTVIGNFASGIDFPSTDPTSAVDIHTALASAIDKGRPIASATISTIGYKRSRTAISGIYVDRAPRHPHVKLIFSDVGRVPQLEAVTWTAEPAACSFYALSSPGLPEAVVVTMQTIGSVVFMSASFHDNVLDGGAVQAALDLVAADPIALLAVQETSA